MMAGPTGGPAILFIWSGPNPLTRLRQLTDWRNRRRGPPSPPKGARGIVKDCVGTTLMTNGATNPKEN